MKLALLTTRLLDVPASGGEICTARLTAALRGAQQDVVLRIGRGPGGTGPQDVTLGPLVQAFDALPWPQRLVSVAAALAAGVPTTVHRLAAGGAARRVAKVLDQAATGVDAIVVDHLQALAWLSPDARRLPTLLVMHNVESDGYLQQAHRVRIDGPAALLRRFVLRREALGLRRLELNALARCTAVACLSPADAQRLGALPPGGAKAPLITVLPGFPCAGPLAPAEPAPDGLRRIGLIGTWTWAPNRDALDWMIGAVLPRLPAHCRLVLAGAGLDGIPLPPGVQSLGRVDHPGRLYAVADLLAIPSLHGSGVQEKAIEAIGTGRPVVASTHALRGLGPQLPPFVHEAGDASRFARLCAEVPLSAADDAVARADNHHALAAWVASRQALYTAALERCLSALRSAAAAPLAAQ